MKAVSWRFIQTLRKLGAPPEMVDAALDPRVLDEFQEVVNIYEWLLAEARWWAESTRGLYDAALDEFAPFPNVVKKPFPWEPGWKLSESDIARAEELSRKMADANE